MRLYGVTMVRNEADIIEASVRHNLSVLDGMFVIDHGSVDDTSEILRSLQDEGLALRVAIDRAPGFFQAEQITRTARAILAGERADFVLPIDADEFLKVESRSRLEAALAELPHDAHALAPWLTYVPDFGSEAVDRFGPAHLRHRFKEERHGTRKSIIGRSFLQPTQYVVSGSHLVDDAARDRPPQHVLLDQQTIALAHCPVRSSEQLQHKVVIGYLAHLATLPSNDQQAFHWRDLYHELRNGRELDRAWLREIAMNYGLPREKWRPADTFELVEDPVHLRVRLRHRAESAPDTLRLLMRFVEGFLAEREDAAPATSDIREGAHGIGRGLGPTPAAAAETPKMRSR